LGEENNKGKSFLCGIHERSASWPWWTIHGSRRIKVTEQGRQFRGDLVHVDGWVFVGEELEEEAIKACCGTLLTMSWEKIYRGHGLGRC